MTTIEIITRDLKKAKRNLMFAKNKKNCPQMDLDNLHDILKARIEIAQRFGVSLEE